MHADDKRLYGEIDWHRQKVTKRARRELDAKYKQTSSIGLHDESPKRMTQKMMDVLFIL